VNEIGSGHMSVFDTSYVNSVVFNYAFSNA
jgi:hypothetical protein